MMGNGRRTAMGNPRPQTSPRKVDEEARLDRKLKKFLGEGVQAYSAEQWRGLREQMRLPLLYPGQFVAYRDHYQGKGDSLCLVRREVLEVSRTLSGLHKRLAKRGEDQQQGVHVTFIEREPPATSLPQREPFPVGE